MRTEMLSKAVVPVVNKLEMEGLLAEGTTNVEVLLCGMVGCTIFRCKAEDTIKGQSLTLRPSDSVWLCEVQEKAKKNRKRNLSTSQSG